MIILEGPDGAGKTTLMANLLDQFPSIQEHERASTSKGGPVENIYDWAERDVETWNKQPLAFYDRHPLVSEPLYGPLIRGGYDSRFDKQGKVLNAKRVRNAFTVYCLPSFDVVKANLAAEEQMEGVEIHIRELWERYLRQMKAHHANSSATMFHYNYRNRADLEDVCVAIDAHVGRWTRRLNGRIA